MRLVMICHVVQYSNISLCGTVKITGNNLTRQAINMIFETWCTIKSMVSISKDLCEIQLIQHGITSDRSYKFNKLVCLHWSVRVYVSRLSVLWPQHPLTASLNLHCPRVIRSNIWQLRGLSTPLKIEVARQKMFWI